MSDESARPHGRSRSEDPETRRPLVLLGSISGVISDTDPRAEQIMVEHLRRVYDWDPDAKGF
jgi:hypothetical protein